MGQVTGTGALVWTRRLIVLRFLGLVPLAALIAFAADRGSVASPTTLVALVLATMAANVLLFLLARRASLHPRVGQFALFASLVVDVAFLLGLVKLTGGATGPLSAFLLLPVLAAMIALPERAALALAALAVTLLFAVVIGEAPRDGEWHPAATAAGMAALLAAAALAAAWYRRRGRFLEERVESLEAERHQRLLDPAPEPATHAAALLPAVVASLAANGAQKPAPVEGTHDRQRAPRGSGVLPQPHSPVEAVADALATDLREPAGVVRARAEALRYELQERGQVADFMPELSRLLHAADRLDDVRLTLAILAGTGAVAGAATDVAGVAREVKEALAAVLLRDHVRIELDAPARLQAVGASHNEVRLVLVRLLDAARRAAVVAGRPALVLTSVRRDGDGVVLEVADTLPMPCDPEPSTWFDPAWSPAERPTLGLALSVSRIIVERRGGRLDVGRSSGNGLAVRILLRAADKFRPLGVGADSGDAPARTIPMAAPPPVPSGSRPRRALARGWDALTRAGRGR